MPEFDIYHIAIPLVFILLAIFFFERQKSKFTNEYWELNKELNISRKALEDARIENKKLQDDNTNRPKSEELQEFFKDIDVKGYSLVRINPDDMFYRGRN